MSRKCSLLDSRIVCLKQPSLLALNYDSQLQVEKWAFLIGVLKLSHAAIAAKPHLLMSSLPKRLGPRWKYLQQLKLHGVMPFTAEHEVIGSLVGMTDIKFRTTYSAPQLSVYDERFQDRWQEKWNLLLDGQQHSVQETAASADPIMLQASLKAYLG